MNIWLYYGLLVLGSIGWGIYKAAREDRVETNATLQGLADRWHNEGLWVRIDRDRRWLFPWHITRASAHYSKDGTPVYLVYGTDISLERMRERKAAA